MDPYRHVITEWLKADQSAPKKQRHTAKRIYDRLRVEYGFTGAESTVRRTVRKLRQEVEGPNVNPMFVLTADPGEMAQVDWGQARVLMGGIERTAHLFCLRLRSSGVFFVWAAPHERMEAFLEGHTRAFEWLGGVPEKIVYDNLSTAVHKILQGHEREVNERFVVLRSYYLFESVFCNPGSGHEKGSVENLVGYVRRNALTPIPEFGTWEELNRMLLTWCEAERKKRKDLWEREQIALRPIPAGVFKPCVQVALEVNKLSLVTYDRNRYSVPTEWIGSVVRMDVYVGHVEIWGSNGLIATHDRSFGRSETKLKLEHFLDALARKPYAVTHAAVVRELPEPYQTLRKALYYHDPSGYRVLVQILLLHREFPSDTLRDAVERALAAGHLTADEIRQDIFNQTRTKHAPDTPVATLPEPIKDIDVAVGDPVSYNRLLEVGA